MQVYLKGIFVVLSSVMLTYQERLPLFGKNCQIEIGIKKHLKRVSFLLRWVIFRFLFCSFVLPKGGATRYTSALLHNRTRKIKAFLSYFFFCMVITSHHISLFRASRKVVLLHNRVVKSLILFSSWVGYKCLSSLSSLFACFHFRLKRSFFRLYRLFSLVRALWLT